MHMPSPNEHHQRLSRFEGTWRGKETMHPSQWDPNGGVSDAITTWRTDLGGFVSIVDYRQERDGQVAYAGHGVYAIDPQTNEVVLHWFDSMGGSYVKPALGGWDGDSLTFQNVTPQGHARYTHTLEGDEYLFKIEVSEDGSIVYFAEWVPQRIVRIGLDGSAQLEGVRGFHEQRPRTIDRPGIPLDRDGVGTGR